MPKKVYLGSSTNLAQKVKKMYVGVDGVARKIKKAYVGVNGIARLFWSGGGKLVYHGTATNFGDNRASYGATSVGNYALFGPTLKYSTVENYSKNLTRGNPISLITNISYGATTVGNYALFAGGKSVNYGDIVYTVNGSLTKSTAAPLDGARFLMNAESIGNYALFIGGTSDEGGYTKYTDAYDTSLTHSIPPMPSEFHSGSGAAKVGDYALFVSTGNDIKHTIEIYNSSLTRLNPLLYSTYNAYYHGASIEGHAIFVGGLLEFGDMHSFSFNTSLTFSNLEKLSVKRNNIAAASVANQYALFAGGTSERPVIEAASLKVVDVYDTSLTKTTTTDLSDIKQSFAGTAVGDYTIFGGGVSSAGFNTKYTQVVDVYTIE